MKSTFVSLVVAVLLSPSLEASDAQIAALQEQMEALKAELAELKAAAVAGSGTDASEEEDEFEDDEEDEMAEIEESLEYFDSAINKLNKNTGGNHLKLGVDFRFAADNIQYKMAGPDGTGDDTKSNDALFSNRLWLNMSWAATDNISFTGQLAYHKLYGHRTIDPTSTTFENFDWIVNENPYDDTLRVRSAYFFYRDDTFLGAEIPWTFSIGRRPSTNGHLINLRDDDRSASPMGHAINVEFDGLSSRYGFENVTGIDGSYLKICMGRGATTASSKFSAAPFASDNVSNVDLIGAILVPYDDGQYMLGTQYYYANNLIDATFTQDTTTGAMTVSSIKDVGSMQSFSAHMMVNGIGDEWSDFLNDTIVFVSGAWSLTNPDAGEYMLGSDDAELGSSVWVGTQIPSLISEGGRWGFEFNHGDKYWRSITHGEDTLVGSKVAARGNAYEAYFTEPLVGKALTFQLRYTFIDYEYTGSNGFFGGNPTDMTDGTGTSMKISDVKKMAASSAQMAGLASQIVDTAQDIRAYIRYRF